MKIRIFKNGTVYEVLRESETSVTFVREDGAEKTLEKSSQGRTWDYLVEPVPGERMTLSDVKDGFFPNVPLEQLGGSGAIEVSPSEDGPQNSQQITPEEDQIEDPSDEPTTSSEPEAESDVTTDEETS